LKFVVDNALPPWLAELLVSAGHDARHVRGYGMQSASDEAILGFVDSDFGAILAAREAERRSFVLFRELSADYLGMLLPVLPALVPELASGCVTVFRQAGFGSGTSPSEADRCRCIRRPVS
jgi:predicted nuclease of predicted toxin-antitoxin system